MSHCYYLYCPVCKIVSNSVNRQPELLKNAVKKIEFLACAHEHGWRNYGTHDLDFNSISGDIVRFILDHKEHGLHLQDEYSTVDELLQDKQMHYYYTRWEYAGDQDLEPGIYHTTWETSQSPFEFLANSKLEDLLEFHQFKNKNMMDAFAKDRGL